MKEIKVIIGGNAKEAFLELRDTVDDETKKGITKSRHQTLLNSIKQKINLLKENPQYGIHIEKKKIPKAYITEYDVNNLWNINLSQYWRMLYTIRGSEIEIIALILDILDHKTYNKLLKYKKK